MALKTASSEVRSRTEMAMVFPVTSNSVKKTTVPMVTIRIWMLPNCLTQPAANADSVWFSFHKGNWQIRRRSLWRRERHHRGCSI